MCACMRAWARSVSVLCLSHSLCSRWVQEGGAAWLRPLVVLEGAGRVACSELVPPYSPSWLWGCLLPAQPGPGSNVSAVFLGTHHPGFRWGRPCLQQFPCPSCLLAWNYPKAGTKINMGIPDHFLKKKIEINYTYHKIYVFNHF